MREDQQGASSQGSTQIEVTSRLSGLYPFIEERHASLPRDLNTVGGDEEDDDLGEPVVEDIDSSHQLDTRIDNLCDILSSFDKGRTPSEYKRDVVDNEQPLSSLSDILVPENISGTIYRLAIYDEAFYRRLRQVVPPEFCARYVLFGADPSICIDIESQGMFQEQSHLSTPETCLAIPFPASNTQC